MPAPTLPLPTPSGTYTLAPPTPTDIPALVAACTESSAVSSLNVPQPYARADAEAYVRAAEAEAGGYFWAIRDEAGLVGMIALRFSPASSPSYPSSPSPSDTTEATSTHPHRSADIGGLYLLPRARSRGLATRAAFAVANWAFAHGFDVLEYECLAENASSVALARRLGFAFTGNGVSESVYPHHVGKPVWRARMERGQLVESV